MSGGGKTQTSTSQVAIPAEVLARYNATNARAEQVAQQPFQEYTGQFVAPVNAQQQQGIAGVNAAANSAQPYFGAATGLTAAGAGPVNPGELQTQRYMNPYVQSVVDPTYRALRQQQAEEMQGATGNAIRSGAFGGDRAGLVAANLARQQQLGTAQAINPLYQQAYTQAQGVAQQQQGVDLQAQQANAARALQAGQQFAGLGTAQQQSQLAGAQAQIGAGTLQQQTEQADTTAKYQQFLQERGYDFQVAQFLANIAMGTGALSGSTTTTTAPAPFFSDERLKHDVEEIGETHDGQPIYRYKMNGDNRTQIGLLAQDVEQHRPDAVGLAAGYKTVDYKKATDGAVERASGGLVPSNVVPFPRAYAPGGMVVDPQDLRALLASQQAFLGPSGGTGPYGGASQGKPGYVPAASLPVGQLKIAEPPRQQQASGLAQAAQTGSQLADLAKMGKSAYDGGKSWLASGKPEELPSEDRFRASGGLVGDGDPILNSVIEDGKSQVRSLNPAAAPKGPEGSGLGDIAKTASGIAGVAKGADMGVKGLSSLGSMFGAAAPEAAAAELATGLSAAPVAAAGAAEGASGLSALLPFLFLKSGGRVGYAEGGEIPEDIVPRVIASEWGGKDPQELRGIAAVIQNRARARGLSPTDVVLEKGQFEPVGIVGGQNDPMGHAEGSPKLRAANQAWQEMQSGGLDPTGGASHFFGPAAQAAKNRPVPDWARKNPGTMIGQTSFHRVDDTPAGGAAPVERTGLAANTPEGYSVPQGGVAAPRRDPPITREPFKYFADNLLEGRNISPEAKSALTSENLWIPALAGVGSMLASRSPWLGNAVGEGLVGGTKAYTDLSKTQSEVDNTNAQTGLTKVNTGRARIYVDGQGRRTFIYSDPRTGQERMMRMEDALDLVDKGQDLPLDAASAAFVKEEARKRREQAAPPVSNTPAVAAPPPSKIESAPLPPPPAAAPPAPAPPVAAQPVPATPAPAPTAYPAENPNALTPEDKELAQKFRTVSRDQVPAWFEGHKDLYEQQQTLAQGAQDFRSQFLPMAAALAAAPKTGVLATGPLQEVLKPVADYINNIARVAGISEGPIDTKQLANSDEARKYIARLREAALAKNDLRAVSALSAVEKGFPSDKISPQGIAKLLAGMSVESQREIDKNEYFQRFKQEAEDGRRDMLIPRRSAAWADLGNRFDKTRDPVYAEDKGKLEKVYGDAMRVTTKDGKKMYLAQDGSLISQQDYAAGKAQPMSVAEYVIKKGRLSDADRAWLVKNYGARIPKYFGM